MKDIIINIQVRILLRKTRSKWKDHSSLTWLDVIRDVKILAKKITELKIEFNKISTISRGGLVPARLIADQLGLKEILVDEDLIQPKTLFVDDIYDSGETFRKILRKTKMPENFTYATLVARKGTRYPSQLVFARKTKGMEYIVFPWEANEHETILKTRYKNRHRTKPKNN